MHIKWQNPEVFLMIFVHLVVFDLHEEKKQLFQRDNEKNNYS